MDNSNPNQRQKKQEFFIGICPHCGGAFQVNIRQFNCRIFRHGILKKTGKQINPHLPKEKCDNLRENDLIWGCGKPFKITTTNDVVKCDYI
jgi:hypothetical protein